MVIDTIALIIVPLGFGLLIGLAWGIEIGRDDAKKE